MTARRRLRNILAILITKDPTTTPKNRWIRAQLAFMVSDKLGDWAERARV
jgi:hypothetical protein